MLLDFRILPILKVCPVLLCCCVSLMYSKEKVCYSFNADLVKAFDRLSRKLVYDKIDNPLVAQIVWSWMDRTESPYFIKWREVMHEIDRSKWNRGVEPGSILGPLLFIIGLNDEVLFKNSIFKSLFADDGQPLYRNLSVMAKDAEDFVKHVYDNDMSLHLEGDKEASFLVCGFGSKSVKNLTIELALKDSCPMVGNLAIKRNYAVKQLGVCIDMTGKSAVFEMGELLRKLKHASMELRSASSWMLASECINLVSTYVVSLLRYAICVWYPVLTKHNKHVIDEIRYWYMSVVVYCCFDTKDVLPWGVNSAKAMRKGTVTEERLLKLTALPSLEQLYIDSCRSHYPHVKRMMELGWLEGVIKENKRSKLLVYSSGDKIRAGSISPLKELVEVVRKSGQDKIKNKLDEAWLIRFENSSSEHRNVIRNFQKMMTVWYLDRMKDCIDRGRFSAGFLAEWRLRSDDVCKIIKRYKRLY